MSNKRIVTIICTLIIILFAFGVGQNANAATVESFARVTQIEPVYYTINEPVTTTQEVCRINQVPVYEDSQRDPSTADVAAGAIIGGLLGNQVGGGSGKDAATIIGAIIGAEKAKKPKTERRIIGYRNVEVCEMVTTNSGTIQRKELAYVIVTARYNGIEFTYQTNEMVRIGKRIPVTVTVTPK